MSNRKVVIVTNTFTSSVNGDTFMADLLFDVKVMNDETMLCTLTDKNGNNYTITFDELFDNMEICEKAVRNTINVGDRVFVLKDAKKWSGTVTKVNRKSYRVSCHGYFQNVEERLFNKDRVAHSGDYCTIVCDYVKDPNGMSVRFEYGDEYLGHHKAIFEWPHEPAYFYNITE